MRSALGEVDARAVSESDSRSQQVALALVACREAESQERAYHESELVAAHAGTVSLFGCVDKRFILLAAGELDLIEQHLQQLWMMRQLAAALLSPGILALQDPCHPDAAASEDWRVVLETSILERACAVCAGEEAACALICHRARVLLRAAQILLALRRFVVARAWEEMGSYLHGESSVCMYVSYMEYPHNNGFDAQGCATSTSEYSLTRTCRMSARRSPRLARSGQCARRCSRRAMPSWTEP